MRPLSLSMAILFRTFLSLSDIIAPVVGVLFFVFLAVLAGILWITWMVFYRRY